MKKINHSTATENDLFTEGNPAQGVPAPWSQATG